MFYKIETKEKKVRDGLVQIVRFSYCQVVLTNQSVSFQSVVITLLNHYFIRFPPGKITLKDFDANLQFVDF